ncbi:hypothetical protein FOA52_003519 [Chlamydomonas sp. UWO 241]|nr:hypothetical protein FOA52_003519 [Chlamydomonas sp. UWO 241]
MMRHARSGGGTVLMEAVHHVDAMRLLLDHPCADPVAMMMHTDDRGSTTLIRAAVNGRADAMSLMLDHPAANATAMMLHASHDGSTALGWAALTGSVDAMRLLLSHPYADPAAAMQHTDNQGTTALMWAASSGRVEPLRMLLEHSCADPAAMFHTRTYGDSALTWAAKFAARGGAYHLQKDLPTRRCVPLLFLLQRVPMHSHLSGVQQAHMTTVMEAMWGGEDAGARRHLSLLFVVDPDLDDARDECIILLLERGARAFDSHNLVMTRIISGLARRARDTERINLAVVRMAIKWQQQQQP